MSTISRAGPTRHNAACARKALLEYCFHQSSADAGFKGQNRTKKFTRQNNRVFKRITLDKQRKIGKKNPTKL